MLEEELVSCVIASRERLVEVRNERIGSTFCRSCRREPLDRAGAERIGSRVGEQPPNLTIEHVGPCQSARRATSISSASGIVPRRRNERRDARSEIADAVVVPGFTLAGVSSTRNTKCRLESIACSAVRTPPSKPPDVAPFS